MKRIKLKMGITSLLITAVVIACVIFLNILVGVLGDKVPMKIDLTKDKVYEFSAQTKDVMKNLEDAVTAYAILPESAEGEYIDYMKEYLDKYSSLSNKFNVEYIDPYQNPAFLNNYMDEDQQASAGSVIIECGDKFRIVPFEELYSQSSLDNSVEIDMEKKVTNAIMNVTGTSSTSNIYFTNGHSEYDSEGLKSVLTEEGFGCKDINLVTEEIPEDAGIIISVAPMADFTAEERDRIDEFTTKNGGKFLLVSVPGMQPMERMDAFLAEWGLKLNYDFVIEADQNSALSSGYGVPYPIAKLQEHNITQKLTNAKQPMLMVQAMSIDTLKSSNSSSVTKLLMTSEKAYGKTNLTSTSAAKEEGDIDGPLCMAAISERRIDNRSNVMVIGSLYAVVEPSILSESAYLNGDFVLNSINYLSGAEKASDIRAKKISPEIMTMTEKQVLVSMIVLQYVLPLIIVLAGLFVWLRRRFK